MFAFHLHTNTKRIKLNFAVIASLGNKTRSVRCIQYSAIQYTVCVKDEEGVFSSSLQHSQIWAQNSHMPLFRQYCIGSSKTSDCTHSQEKGGRETDERWIKREIQANWLRYRTLRCREENKIEEIFMMSNYRNFQFILLAASLLQKQADKRERERERFFVVVFCWRVASSFIVLLWFFLLSSYTFVLIIFRLPLVECANTQKYTIPCLAWAYLSPLICYYSARFSNG